LVLQPPSPADALARVPPALPPRRSSDLIRHFRIDANAFRHLGRHRLGAAKIRMKAIVYDGWRDLVAFLVVGAGDSDDRPYRIKGGRKSTRLNSSHVQISYAGLRLKKNRT